MQTIKRLPKSVHSSLRSSIVLFDLSRVVEELVYNSIDANASKIDISVNARACYVKVEDDGCGITRDELVLVGEKYATSKFHNVMVDGEPSSRSFGLNGEALASLSDISVVEVRTKARGRPNSYCKIIKGSKCSHLGIDEQREVVGTTVIVRELFYNQPVRRKQMQSSYKRELHLVKKSVLRVALIHPQVSLRLFDIESEDELLYTIPSSSPLPLVSNILGKNVSSCLHEIATSDKHFALSGHISRPTDVFCNKDFQYLYINSRFVSKSPIHNMLNNLASSFQSSARNEEIDVRSKKRQKNEVYPAYLLNLCCPRSSYDLHFEPSQTIVEFKDWQTVMYFIERTITDYWKKHAPQLPEVKAIGNDTCVPLERDVKSSQELLRRHGVQKKEDVAELYQTALQKNTVRDMNFDTAAPAEPKDNYLSLDMEPSTWRACYDQISDASHTDDVARNGRKFGHKQICSLQSYSYQWLEDGSSLLEDSDLSSANPTICKMQKTEDIFHGHAYSGKFGLLQDAEIEIGPEIKLQEYCFESPNKPNRMTCDFVQKQTNIQAHISGRDGFYVDFDKLNEDCLLNEISKTITDVSCPQMPHFNDGLCPEDVGSSKSSCSVRKKSSKRQNSANAIAQMKFHDMQAVCESDYMDRSFIKDTCGLHFFHPFSLADTPRSHSRARIDLELHGRSNESIKSWNCENIGTDFGFTSDRFNIDSSMIFEGSKHLNNFGNGTQSPSYFNHEYCSVGQFASKQDRIPLKSKHDARMSYDISPEKSSTGCHLNVSFSQVAKSSKLTEDQYGCSQRPRLSRGRYRSRSAPPFYRGKRKFPRLNEPLTKLTTEGGKYTTVNDSGDADITPVQEYTSHMNATQPIPETFSNDFSDLNFSLKGNVKMCEEKCSDELEDSTASDEITKWRDDSDHHAVSELQHGPFEHDDDVLSISYGPLHLSCSVLVPECIDKNCFEEARVLLQLDKKFIPVISGEVLLLVDQHAADERIRLEELRRKVLSDDGRGITYLDSEEDLVLPETGFQLFQKYMQQIQSWGWIINSTNSCESFKKNMNILRRQSRRLTLAAVPCILGVTLTGKDLMDFIQQLDDTDGSSAIPPAVIRILNFKACRGAIMFGDPLLPSECSLIIEELKATSLCFQCAHGRPTTVPIVNVASLRGELARLGAVNGRQEETWHGLSHHGPSLERARTRLRELRKLRGGL
ncbi:DNA mismatch repair protein MLH3 isoform X1 [Oryza glaberrima]|uniref:DNA mismatch repair protein MLH3 isoform X1 n=1 Tax=Oryza glaberrima TaxID=4538 RepID=UPI00224BFB9A|nr:DNA mismatch repair protein MLH3 isoform X1 [Oryza glaberrima]